MNELLKVEINVNNEQVINGRMLYEFLQIKTPYTMWINRMISYGFIENIDYVTDNKNVSRTDGAIMPQKEINHILKLNMAKELCMLARNERGKEARKYFIKCEEAWNSEDMIMGRALKIMHNRLQNTTKQLEEAKAFIEEAKPKLTYYDTILNSVGTMTSSQIGADYGMSAIKLNRILNEQKLIKKVNNQWILYAKYQNQGLTESKTFDVEHGSIVGSYVSTRWTQKGRLKIHEILTNLGYVANVDKSINRMSKRDKFVAQEKARQLSHIA